VQAAVQAVAKLTGQSGVDYLVNNAGTAGPPVPAHEEYESIKHSCIFLAQQHCNLMPSAARPSHDAIESTFPCNLVCMDWSYICTMRRYGHDLIIVLE
jgi:NAD(P)-dependent dehydrogenase (short-subunit alcohol dehydrogenase family)